MDNSVLPAPSPDHHSMSGGWPLPSPPPAPPPLRPGPHVRLVPSSLSLTDSRPPSSESWIRQSGLLTWIEQLSGATAVDSSCFLWCHNDRQLPSAVASVHRQAFPLLHDARHVRLVYPTTLWQLVFLLGHRLSLPGNWKALTRSRTALSYKERT